MGKTKYKPLGIKEDTYNKLNDFKSDLSKKRNKPVSFDEAISELLK